MIPSAGEQLAAAIAANDAQRVQRTLDEHPELKSTLDGPLETYSFGQTALMAAVHKGSREMVDVLLRAGADINARSDWWAGSFGVLDNDHGLADFLIERGAIVDAHAAARLGRIERLRELVERDPNVVHARGGDGQTPLHFAANVEIAAYLLEHGADINARDVDHESTAAQYMIHDRQEVVRFLVGRGCRTDILMAAALGNAELVREHLRHDPETIRMDVSERHFPMSNPRAGGTIYIWTLGSNKTPHQVARDFGHPEIWSLLMDRSPAELKLAEACMAGDEQMVQELQAAGKIEISEDAARRLAGAAQHGDGTAVRLMLANGWPVDVRGGLGATPLHWAAWHGDSGMVREILKYRPPMEAVDAVHGGTPLGWAIHGSTNSWRRDQGDYGSVVRQLLDAGAKAPEDTDLEASPEVIEALRR